MSENTEWQDHTAAGEENNGQTRPYNDDEGGYENRRPHYDSDGNERPRRPRIMGDRQDRRYNRYNNGYQRSGYQQRPYNASPDTDGYQRQGGYHNGYQRQGGYNDRPQGGYNNSYSHADYQGHQPADSADSDFNPQPLETYQPQEGGYPRQGGYGRQQGGYGRQQGGYGRQQGGYGRQQGGYGRQQGGYGRQQAFGKRRIEYKEYIDNPDAPIRLNKFLANAGVCSRREADQFIGAGVVKVNGETVTELGTKVLRTDTVHFHDQLVSLEKKVYVLLNKPKDYVTTSDDPQQRKTVMELVKNCCKERIYPVGRLDRSTMGVLLLTNDGELASKLTHPKYLKRKIYHVFLDKNITAADLKQIAEGVTLEDGTIRADAISYASETDKKQVGIEIHSGKNRIVRRIFESLGYRVLKLDRVMFAGLTKKGLKRGDWRFLTEQEVALLHMGGGQIRESEE